MGKASRKKAQRCQGAGQSRAEFDRERAADRQERVILQASQAFSELGNVARSLEQAEAKNVKAWWGRAPVVPATIPEWEAGSLGHSFFSDSNIVKTAAAPPLTTAVIPAPEKLAADRGLLTGAVSVLTRAVVFDGVKASDPALDPFLDLLARLEREKIHGTGLMQLVQSTLVAPEDAFRVGLAVLAELAELCRTNAKSILGT